MNKLQNLHADIDARVHHIREGHSDWPCAKGCDACCRQLARLPQLTTAEWELLRPALAALPPEQIETIRRKMDAAAGRNSAPVTCPLLDEASGACPVYAQRPIACRTYGFYVQRGIGLYCQEIKAGVDRGELAEVVWGNQDAVDRSLAQSGETSGETQALDAWFAREL